MTLVIGARCSDFLPLPDPSYPHHRYKFRLPPHNLEPRWSLRQAILGDKVIKYNTVLLGLLYFLSRRNQASLTPKILFSLQVFTSISAFWSML